MWPGDRARGTPPTVREAGPLPYHLLNPPMMSPSLVALSLVLATTSGSDPSDVDVAPPQDDAAAKTPDWAGSVLLGLTETQGNSENFSASLSADAVREGETHRYTIKSFFSYVDQGGEITERKVGASGQYDFLAGEDYYYFATVGAEADDRANLDLRYFAGGGLGYDFYDREKFKLKGEAGLTYFVEEFDDGSDSDSIAAILGYDLSYFFSEETKLKQSFKAYPPVDEPSDVFLRLDTRLETKLTESMLGSVQYVVDWDNSPAVGAKRDDHRFVISLGWSFGR